MENLTLSPETQSVLDAANQAYDQAATVAQGTAAALRAVVKELKCFGITEKNILAIADELEAL